mgnify:CR=1 FL=1
MWEPEIAFSDNGRTNPKDHLTNDERQQIRNAALEYGNIPSYSNVITFACATSRW